MRTSVSILLLIVAAVLGISTTDGNHPTVSAAAATNGYGIGQFWWSNAPADVLCENGSYATYDTATQELALRRGDFARVIERYVIVTNGISVAPECGYIAGAVADRLVIWDVVSGKRSLELPNASNDPLVLWSPDGDSALIAADGSYYLWRDDEALALDTPLRLSAYPSVYWDGAHGQVLVGTEGGVLAFDTASGALHDTFAVAGMIEYRIVGKLLIATGRGGIDVWDLESAAHVRMANRTSPPTPSPLRSEVEIVRRRFRLELGW